MATYIWGLMVFFSEVLVLVLLVLEKEGQFNLQGYSSILSTGINETGKS
jgi:hypothetical protein